MVAIRLFFALCLCIHSAYAAPVDGRSMTQVLDISKDASGSYRNVKSNDDELIKLAAVNSAYANRRDALAKRNADMRAIIDGKLVLYRAIFADGASQDVVVHNPLSSLAVKFHSERILLPFLNYREPARVITFPPRLIDTHIVEETGYWKDWSVSVCEGAGCTRHGSTWISTGYTFVAYDPYGPMSDHFFNSSEFGNPLSTWEGQASSLGGAAMAEFYRIMQRIVDLYANQTYAQ